MIKRFKHKRHFYSGLIATAMLINFSSISKAAENAPSNSGNNKLIASVSRFVPLQGWRPHIGVAYAYNQVALLKKLGVVSDSKYEESVHNHSSFDSSGVNFAIGVGQTFSNNIFLAFEIGYYLGRKVYLDNSNDGKWNNPMNGEYTIKPLYDFGVKLGYQFGRWVPYGKLGMGRRQMQVTTDSGTHWKKRYDPYVGLGIAYSLTEHVGIALEYTFAPIKRTQVNNTTDGQDLNFNLHRVKFGVAFIL